ncbi:MAG: hypothetical protein ACFB6S_03350 [Geminicoccaceae bacterium]
MRFVMGLGLAISGLVFAMPAETRAQDYDNPQNGIAPCVVLNGYEMTSRGSGEAERYRASVNLENICGRTVELAVCFRFVEEVDGSGEASCHDDVLRPWSRSSYASSAVPVRITGPEYQWRYLE